MSSHQWISLTTVLLLLALHHELSGVVNAGITVGLGGVSTGSVSLFNETMGSIQPVRKIEMTTRKCDPEALARIADDRVCNKYYVCFNGRYAGLYCPVSMAFDYGLQECNFRVRVDCSSREYVAQVETPTTTQTSATTQVTVETGTIPTLIPQPATTTTPQSVTIEHAPVLTVPTESIVTSSNPMPISPPISEQQVTKTTDLSGNVMTLPFGAKVIVPFGSTIFLPAGSQIQVESSPDLHRHHHRQQQHHHHHRRSSPTLRDRMVSSSRDNPIPGTTSALSPLTKKLAAGMDAANDPSGHHQATDVDDDMLISDNRDDDKTIVLNTEFQQQIEPIDVSF